MKKNVFCLLGISMVLAAPVAATADENCVNPTKRPKLWVDDGQLWFHGKNKSKKPICVSIPGQFEIKIKYPDNGDHTVGLGEARVTAKSGSSPTIEGENNDSANPDVITVTIDGVGFNPGDEFGFFIEVDNVGVLDPRVRIIDTNVLELDNWLEIDELLRDEVGLSLEEVQRLSRPQSESE